MNKRTLTIALLMLVTLISSAVIIGLFAKPSQKIVMALTEREEAVGQYQELIKRRENLETVWESKKKYFSQNASREELLNSWQKAMMTLAAEKGIVLNKLEPAGLSEGGISIFLSFESNMKKLLQFIYALRESEPLVRVESLFLRQEEGTQKMTFELMLGKVFA